MKVNNASVRWNEGWLNHPQLILDVDRSEVNYDTMRYEQRGSIYYAEREGLVSFFAYSGPGDGYGGHEFPITMKDGTKKILKGPWSSRASAINSMGFGPCLDMVFRFNGNEWHQGAGAITLRLAQRVMKQHNVKAYLIPMNCHGEVNFTPSVEPGRVVKPDGSYYDDNGNMRDKA